jgi:hypothetical protein
MTASPNPPVAPMQPSSLTKPRTPPADAFAVRVWNAAFTLVPMTIGVLFLAAKADPTLRPIFLTVSAVLATWVAACLCKPTRRLAGLPLMLIIAPSIIRRGRCRLPAEVLELSAFPGVPPDVARSFDHYRAGLEREGFRSAALLKMRGPHVNPRGDVTDMLIECFENPSRRHTASVSFVMVASPPKAQRVFLRFSQWTREGSMISTGNTDMGKMFPSPSYMIPMSLPGETTVSRVYSAHLAMLARFAGAQPFPELHAKTWKDRIDLENTRSTDEWKARRIIVPTSIPGEFATPFWKCCTRGWAMIGPIRDLRRRLNRRKWARRRLKMGI